MMLLMNNNIINYENYLKQNVTEEWRFPIVSSELIGFVPEITKHKIFEFNSVGVPKNSISRFRLKFHSNLRVVFPISFLYHFSTIDIEQGVLYGAILLSGLYVLIIFEVGKIIIISFLSLRNYYEKLTTKIIVLVFKIMEVNMQERFWFGGT